MKLLLKSYYKLSGLFYMTQNNYTHIRYCKRTMYIVILGNLLHLK